ncbi:MAG: hypothetical protein SPI87_05350 [Anaerobutyricum sp.]|nr:hypothetical protein [Anaerobutyricum sp.]
MVLRAIRDFHKKTEDRYREEEQKNMEQWKKNVMLLHEKSDFVFYFDDYELELDKISTFTIRGEVVKGTMEKGERVFLYDGQGNLLGQGEVLSDPEEKEEKHLGIIKTKKNEFLLKITGIYGTEASDLKGKKIQNYLRNMLLELSILSDRKMV